MPFKKGQSGNPKGRALVKPRFADYVTPEDRNTFAEFMISSYMGDMNVAKWVGDQLFGKAPQPLEHSGHIAEKPLDNELHKDESLSENKETEQEN